MTTSIKVPDIGEADAVEVIEVLVAEGDQIEQEQALLVLESDKATMEVPSSAAGKLLTLHVSVGDKLSEGDLIAELEASEPKESDTPEESSSKPDKNPEEDKEQASPPAGRNSSDKQDHAQREDTDNKATAQPPQAPSPPGEPHAIPHASPSIRLLARELGVDLQQVHGSGRKGRIVKEDVQQFVKAAMQGGHAASAVGSGLPQMPKMDFAKFGETETQQLPRIRKLSAANLHRNWVLLPHVTQFESADITELEKFRKAETQRGSVKLTLLPFVLKAVAVALRQQPEFNSSLSADGNSLILKKYCNVGFAADTDQGLVVPVIRDIWQKTVSDLAGEAADLAGKARDGKLSPADMQGGCFSVSSLGGIGGSHFTPIINAPEVAILGVSRARTEAVWDGESFQPRTMLPLSLSYDHRVIDGAAAARFAVLLAELLSDVRRLCL